VALNLEGKSKAKTGSKRKTTTKRSTVKRSS
jgi:hypothetical protein